MKPLMTVFIDGLKPESLEYMDFLNSLSYKRRLKTQLGYSITCHASMYSGVYPTKHLLWFVWQYAPETSPFGWTKGLKSLRVLDSIPLRYFIYKSTTLFHNYSSIFGIPFMVNLPIRYWSFFDVSEKKFWNEPGYGDYMNQYPTIFDILRCNKVEFDVVGMDKKYVSNESSLVKQHLFSDIKPWTYLFIGDLDNISHKFGQNSEAVVQKIKKIDRILEDKYRTFEKMVGVFDFFCFSDHGHVPVFNKVDLYSVFEKFGQRLNNYVHIVDANYARFWFRNRREERKIVKILSELDCGLILNTNLLEKYNLTMPDNRYGDIVFYLDVPSVFSKTIWGFSKSLNSMHGYLPDYSDCDGVFVSNRQVIDTSHVELVDIMPSILSLLSQSIPDYVDGKVLWK